MPKSETLEKKIHYLQAMHNILLTKGGSLNEGEVRWIAHLEEQLSEYGIFFSTSRKVA